MTDQGPHCPTCRCAEAAAALAALAVDCAAVWPDTVADVTPVRCRLQEGHLERFHWHPPLWPATPDVVWPVDG